MTDKCRAIEFAIEFLARSFRQKQAAMAGSAANPISRMRWIGLQTHRIAATPCSIFQRPQDNGLEQARLGKPYQTAETAFRVG